MSSPFSSPNPTEHHRHPPAVCRRQDVKKNRLGCESFSQGASSLTAFDVSWLYYNAQRATPPLSTAPQRKRSRRQRSQSALHVGPPVGKAARVFALTRLECNSFWNLIVSLPICYTRKLKKESGSDGLQLRKHASLSEKASEMKESGEETPTERTPSITAACFFFFFLSRHFEMNPRLPLPIHPVNQQ